MQEHHHIQVQFPGTSVMKVSFFRVPLLQLGTRQQLVELTRGPNVSVANGPIQDLPPFLLVFSKEPPVFVERNLPLKPAGGSRHPQPRPIGAEWQRGNRGPR